MEPTLSFNQKRTLKKIMRYQVDKPFAVVTDIPGRLNMVSVAYLTNHGLLENVTKGNIPIVVSLTPDGASYFERRKSEWIHELNRSFLVPIAVSVATTLIIWAIIWLLGGVPITPRK